MQDLKLIALDAEDLEVISTHLQDAVLRVGDIAFLKSQKRFAAITNRFDWMLASERGSKGKSFTRRRAGLRFERVLDAKVTKIDLRAKDTVLSLLSIGYKAAEGAEGPEGYITLNFSGGGAIRLEVECIEAELSDLGAAWSTRRRPQHAANEPDESR